MKRINVRQICDKYRRGEKLAMLTAYDSTFARLVDESGVDMILVEDTLGVVVQGHETTIPVTLDNVIYHTSCVVRGSRRALVIADLPFMSYQASPTQAMLAAGRAMKEGGAGAVKLEGGLEMAPTVRLMTEAGIPVMAHIGLRPQRFHQMGGYRIYGRNREEARTLVEEAKAFEEAGAFSIVLEGVTIETAGEVTDAVGIPTIGIGCGPRCSGQVLVIYDILNLDPSFKPVFVKHYAQGYEAVTGAAKRFVDEVRAGTFPTEEHGHPRK